MGPLMLWRPGATSGSPLGIGEFDRLCGYATDYGRLSPLFSVRGYSLPALAVELNPLNLKSGRGTIAACIERFVWMPQR